jgi:hypothetical protein
MPLTTIALSRAVLLGFGAARKSTRALPWPWSGDSSLIQAASVAAVHVHSGCVVTLMLPAPPSAANEAAGAVTATSHLTGAGPATDSVDVEPQAQRRIVADSSATVVQEDPAAIQSV